MKEPLRIEVEPLSEQRWNRIERSLMVRLESEPSGTVGFTQGDHRHSVRGWIIPMLAVAFVAGLVLVVLTMRPSPEHDSLDHPSRISTGRTPSHLALPGLTLEVQPESAVVVGPETPQGQLIVLDAGSIVCRAAPRASDAPLIVQAGGVRVRVVGTRFSVTRLGERARVEVFEGAVEVRSADESLQVRAGEVWPPLARSPAREAAEVGDPDLNPEPAAPPSVEAQNTAPMASAEAVSEQARRERPAAIKRRASAVRAEQAAPSAVAEAAPRRTSQEVFEQATALESSDPARASRLYRMLESGTDSWAQNALYARGRLAASRGNRGEARRLLQRYLELFPRGTNAQDARAVLRRLR